jgi:hypothetical protein
MTDVRTICRLSDEDFEARRAQLRKSLFPRVRAREELPDGLVLLFEATPELRGELDDFVAFERECCPGLELSLADDSGTLRLEIRGIDPLAGDFAGVGPARGTESPGGSCCS